MENEIEASAKIFKKFFKNDLYGKFDDDENIILSRGGWNDRYVSFPKFFSFCINYTLKKHWTGYSDSLGHKNTLRAITKLVNIQPISKKYKINNIALTMGNVMTIGIVFRQLRDMFPDSIVITLKPYYSPIVKSISCYFQDILFISSLRSEETLLEEINNALMLNNNAILFLSNSIGVEGRIFSNKFWQEITKIIQKRKVYLVIDEGLWFEQLKYCPEINNNYVIRIVSLSKKYGLPGCKLGYMIAGKEFMDKFYNYASSCYGGPPSVFFLLSEFIYQFEYIYYSNIRIKEGLRPLYEQYGISYKCLKFLYYNFINTHDGNRKKLQINRKIFISWLKSNSNLIEDCYDFGGINIFIKPRMGLKAYNTFLRLISEDKTSIMPSSCLGDECDSMFRITLLEKSKDLRVGLNKLKKTIVKNSV